MAAETLTQAELERMAAELEHKRRQLDQAILLFALPSAGLFLIARVAVEKAKGKWRKRR